VPWPADYGGVVDLFYKVKALKQQGILIHLHCFTKDRTEQKELNKYCVSVNYYQRSKGLKGFSFSIPYIVNSRACKELAENLEKDNYPILMEGIHCTYFLSMNKFTDRKIIVRLHNTEFEYYKHLAKYEGSIFKKIYFLNESRLLKKYEMQLANKAAFVAVSESDVTIYKDKLNATQVSYLPVFIPHTLSIGAEGKGCFCLYHGNLSVNENEAAAIWLLENVFNDISIPFIIAGKDPSKKLEQAAMKRGECCLIANPSEKEMQDLIAKAQIHILPSMNNTGVKLKLINALFNGRHCVVNEAGVAGSGLEKACHTATDAASFKTIIKEIYEQPFTEQEKDQRQGLLQTMYNNELNAKKLITLLY
jgi:hypothetical protein